MPPGLSAIPESPLLRFLFKGPVRGAALGFGASQLENHTLLKDTDPSTKNLNSLMATSVGAGMGSHPSFIGPGLLGYAGKSMGLLGYDAAKKYVNIQQPIAETNLHTAQLSNDTARMQQQQAGHISAKDMAGLGLGAAGVGGLGYYLYKTLGPGKKKVGPKVTVDLPMGANGKRRPGDVKIEGDMDTLDLSKSLYTRLKRDQHRQLRTETRESSRPDNVIDMPKAASYGIRCEVEDTTAFRLQNIAKLLS
jgi:hypothetical protein